MYVLMKEPSTLEVVSDFLDNEIYIDACPYVFYEYSSKHKCGW
jgi:pantothenate kinase